MATFTQSLATFTNNTDANFRLWGSYISARFAAVGLIQTADTGQINWVTVTAPLAIGALQGYEVWRFADALQATAPVYFKIWYGAGVTSAQNPGMDIIFGSGSDGIGNLTGVLSSTIACQAASTTSATTTWYGSGSTGRFVLAVRSGTGTTSGLLSFERSKDSTGADTSEAVLILTHSGANATSSVLCVAWDTATGNKMTGVNITTAYCLTGSASGITGTQIATYPFMWPKGVFMYPGMNLLMYWSADIVLNSVVPIPFYGTSRVYVAMGSNTNGMFVPTTQGYSGGTSNGMLIRYE